MFFFSCFSPSPLQLAPHKTNEEDLKERYYKVSFLSPVSESSLLMRSISLTIVSNVIKRASVLVRQEGEKSEIKALWFITSQYVIPGQRELVLSQRFSATFTFFTDFDANTRNFNGLFSLLFLFEQHRL